MNLLGRSCRLHHYDLNYLELICLSQISGLSKRCQIPWNKLLY